MNDVFSKALCDERHQHSEELAGKVERRLIRLENRFFATLMLLIANLVTVAVTLGTVLIRLK